MRIARSTKHDGTVAPSARNYLAHIPANYQFINEHARRAPIGIYNVSLGLLTKDFDSVLEDFFKTKAVIESNAPSSNAPDAAFVHLLEAQHRLIHSLQSHVDDCYSVLASLVSPATGSTSSERFTDRWLHQVGFPTLAQFKNAIAAYRNDYLAHLVNGLKHRQNRLRGIFFRNSTEVRLGYYLEEPDSAGIPGPSFILHDNGNSAFSFARDILFNLYHVYYISESLVDAVKGVLIQTHSFTQAAQKSLEEDTKWLAVVQRAARLRAEVFPEEVIKPYPYVSLIGTDSADRELALIYPVSLVPLSFPPEMQVTSFFEGDGVTKTYRLPYLKKSKFSAVAT